MGAYIYSILCAGIFTGMILSLSPDGEKGRIGKFIAFAGALSMALAVMSPIVSRLKSFGTDIDLGFGVEKEQAVNPCEYYASSVGNAFCSIYRSDPSLVRVNAFFDPDKNAMEKIELYYTGQFNYDPEEAGKLLGEIYGFKVEIIVQ
ncbi:MAG: hypothetical protein E7575_04470 [Ruminococcaceae bacterium]|nr:hypothetical protein [Oscillospiraceae bacterium]